MFLNIYILSPSADKVGKPKCWIWHELPCMWYEGHEKEILFEMKHPVFQVLWILENFFLKMNLVVQIKEASPFHKKKIL